MALTVFEFQARRIERIAAAMAHFITTTAPDKLDWRPTGDGADTRTVLEQVGECVQVNRYVAALLRGEPAQNNSTPIAFTDAQDAQQQIIASGQELAAAVRSLQDDDLERTFPHWRGLLRGETLLEMPYRNMAYHNGQINFIQTLYGDTEFHLPPTWI